MDNHDKLSLKFDSIQFKIKYDLSFIILKNRAWTRKVAKKEVFFFKIKYDLSFIILENRAWTSPDGHGSLYLMSKNFFLIKNKYFKIILDHLHNLTAGRIGRLSMILK